MFLMNAIYFKAPWLYTFDKELTRNRKFYVHGNVEKDFPTMFINEDFKVGYIKDPIKATVIYLPYSVSCKFFNLKPRFHYDITSYRLKI